MTAESKQETANFDDIRRTESRFRGGAGVSLFRAAWCPPRPRRVLVVVHGYGEHCLRYDDFGLWFAQRGCAVHAYDQRGHGRSPGPRGHMDDFDDLLDDLSALLDSVRLEHPGLPIAIVGHSFGGLVAATFARERAPEVAAVVLSGPLMKFAKEMSPVTKLASRVLSVVLPRVSVDAGINAEGLSTDPQVGIDYLADQYVHSRISFRFSSEMLAAMQRTGRGGADARLPILVLHGGSDPLCAPEGSRIFVESLNSSEQRGVEGVPPRRSKLEIYPGMRHEIFNEIDKEAVFADLLGWIEESDFPAPPTNRLDP